MTQEELLLCHRLEVSTKKNSIIKESQKFKQDLQLNDPDQLKGKILIREPKNEIKQEVETKA